MLTFIAVSHGDSCRRIQRVFRMEMTSNMRIQVVFGLAPGGAAQRSGLIHVGMLRSLDNKKPSCFCIFISTDVENDITLVRAKKQPLFVCIIRPGNPPQRD